jgi:hypothetical protein
MTHKFRFHEKISLENDLGSGQSVMKREARTVAQVTAAERDRSITCAGAAGTT